MALFKPLTEPKQTNDPFLDAVVSMVSDDSNVQYTGARAMNNSDVFTAIKIIASDIASSDLQCVVDGNIHDMDMITFVNDKPNDYMDGWHFKFALAANLLLNGNSFAEVERESDNSIKALHIVPNSQMSVKQSDSGSLIYEVTKDKKPRRIAVGNILHFKYFTQDGIIGTSPLSALKDELKIQGAGNKTIFNFFSRGVNGGGILKVKKADLDTTAKESIRKKFEEANGSANGDNALKTIVLDESFDYAPLEINTDVLKLVNSSDWTTKQIAKVYGLSTDRLGVEAQHSNTLQSNMMYLQNTLLHYFKAFTSELSNKLITDDEKCILRFNSDRLLENDPQTTLENTIKAVQGSLMTINEGRSKLGLSAVDGGDRLLASLNYTHLDGLDRYQNTKKEDTLNE